MNKFNTVTKTLKIDQDEIEIIDKQNFESFSEDILGLGKINSKSNQVNALSVMFDLEGFTKFCKQIDPHLAVPEFLSKFLQWIFKEIKVELTEETHEQGYKTYAPLPFLSKFMGDGLLFLWDTSNLDEVNIVDIVVSMYEICKKYKSEFHKKIEHDIVDAPTKLRCGIATGIIYSVGNGNDFVGPCINVSARLQKLHSLSFCFSRRGINPNIMDDSYLKSFIVKKVNIRGIGESELVCILKNEFENLDESEKINFK